VPGVVETTLGKAPVQGHLTTFKTLSHRSTGAGFLTFVSAATGFSKTTTLASPKTLATVLGTWLRF
jgi:hypothetical protein